jgi:GMP synthase-like glutamine amidotransferase
MKPVAIFRHSPTEGPGYFSAYLDARGIPWRLFATSEGEPVPADPRAFSGIAMMGGPMSVNDPLPWIEPTLALIRAAVAGEVPVLGHCLGGQLMSKALGGVVTRNPVKEIGWGLVRVSDDPAARGWFGETTEFLSFHWHGETFTIPAGARRIAESPYCPNQAFVLGPHLAMQCHVEMTSAMIRTWAADSADELDRHRGPSVQTPAEMEVEIEARVRDLNAIARRLYDRWAEGLAR